jgi:oligopeptidase B
MPRKTPHVETLHGERRIDDYFWLREKDNPEVRGYLEEENELAAKWLAPTGPFQEKLYLEMKGRIKETDLSVPYRKGGWWYVSRTEEGRQYRTYCRRRQRDEGPEELLLDLNAMAEGHSFMALGTFEISDDGNLLAYSSDHSGFRVYALHVKDLRSGEVLGDTADDVGSVAWAADSRTLFYTVKNTAKRSYRLYRHVIGTAEHTLVLEEEDESLNLSVVPSRSGAWLVLYASSHTTTEARLLPADRPEGTWKLVEPRRQGIEYYISHHDDSFYIRVNDLGRNFRIVRAPVGDPSGVSWKEIVPHDPEVMLEHVDLFRGHLLLWSRRDGLPAVRVEKLSTGKSHSINFDEEVYSIHPHVNEEFDTTSFRFSYESLVSPAAVFEYDMDSRDRILLKQEEVLGGFDPGRYVSHRIWATAMDGARIPVSMVRLRELPAPEPGPCVLVGYGAYGFSYPIGFNSSRLSLLDRGVTVAIGHIRGGGEMGKAWHDQGRMHLKMNTFTDFIAVAEHLIAEGHTAPDRLIIEGGSAGGLLTGAVVNLRPDLWKAVVSHVPFVDVINTMLDESLPLTVGEFEEWGNPKVKEDYDQIRRYCPYSNLEAKDYPAMLIRTAFNDSQVMYWEPAKYVARLRDLKTDDNPLLFVTNMGAGHGGSSGRYDRLKETALDYAFILAQFGIGE